MLLHAVIVPPPAMLEAVAQVVQSVDTPAAAAAPPARKGLLTRLGGRDVPAADSSNAAEPELDLIAAQQMILPITGFGNVTTGDASRLAEALYDAAATWACPTVHFAGGAELETSDGRSVLAKLDGDLAALMTVAKGVTQSVQSLGFFVDRRKFRPSLSVATVTARTTAPYLESVVEALEAFRGEPWTVQYISLTKPSFDAGSPMPMEVYRIPLGQD